MGPFLQQAAGFLGLRDLPLPSTYLFLLLGGGHAAKLTPSGMKSFTVVMVLVPLQSLAFLGEKKLGDRGSLCSGCCSSPITSFPPPHIQGSFSSPFKGVDGL